MSFTFGAPVESTFSASTAAVTVTGVSTGDTIIFFVSWNPGGGSITISGVSDGSSYTLIGSPVVTGAGFDVAAYYLQNASSGSHTVTATFVGGGTAGYVAGFHVSGAAVSSVLDGQTSQDSNFAGTGTNAVTCGTNFTPANAGDAIIGLFVAGTSSGATYSAGTSPNAFTTLGFATSYVFGEQFLQGSAAAISPTCTNTGTNSDIGAIAFGLKALGNLVGGAGALTLSGKTPGLISGTIIHPSTA